MRLTDTGNFLADDCAGPSRPVILHYHFFKNAGTSVDEVLKENFAGRWLEAEFPGPDNAKAVAAWIARNPAVCAFSSHTALMPLPVLEGVCVIPIVFLRHPLDRIASAYRFEQSQPGGSRGSIIAQTQDLAGYVRARLDSPKDFQCRNFHAFRLAKQVPGAQHADLEAALSTLMALPFVGVVEEFDLSLARLEETLRPHFPEFICAESHLNASPAATWGLARRLEAMRGQLGDELYSMLLRENMKDICLHHAALARLYEL